VKSADEYVALMNNLNLSNPKMMDVAVPANMRQGLRRRTSRAAAGRYSAREALDLVGQPDVALIDLRERTERERHGCIPRLAARALPRAAGEHRPGRTAA
jgi:sulfur dioxygenase